MSPRVLVTGANGFVGSRLLTRLCAKRTDAVGLVRRTSDLGRLQRLFSASGLRLEHRLRFGDLRDQQSLVPALRDRNLIIHSAAMAADWGSDSEFMEANAEGVRRLLDAVPEPRKSESIRCILISTANVAGYGRRNVTEHDPAPEPRFIYSKSKLEGERIASERCDRRGIGLQILRPGGAYGPEDWKWSRRMIAQIEGGAWPLIGGGRAVFTPVYIENLASAVEEAIRRPEADGVFNITDGARISWLEFSELIASSLGVRLATRNVPFALAYPVAAVAELVYSIVGSNTPPLATRYRVVRAAKDFDYSCERAVRELGYRPDPDIAAHIAATVDWYRATRGFGGS